MTAMMMISVDEFAGYCDTTTPVHKRKHIMCPTVSAVLDRTKTSIRKSTMILASVLNETGTSTASTILSKSTVHRRRQLYRRESADTIREGYCSSKSVVHWDGKLLPDLTVGSESSDAGLVDRLPVLVSSLTDGTTKLLGVPKLKSGTGNVAANAVLEQVRSWNCEPLIVGMCFDTTASNTGRLKGACTILEQLIGRNLLWMACRHHMFEVLLSDAFGVCLGPSTGPDILFFKRFRENWPKLNTHCIPQHTPKILATDSLKMFISEQLTKHCAREDYKEFISLAALMVGLETSNNSAIRKPGALHRARWMAKAIYSMKIELLYDGNETAFSLTAHELQGLQRFNRFVVSVYIQSWFTARSTADAPVNDILLIQRLEAFDDIALSRAGLKMMHRHSWYLSPELATLAIFSDLLSTDEKAHIVLTLTNERGSHLLKSLPKTVADLNGSRTFFETAGIDDSFLDIPIDITHTLKQLI